MSFSWWSPWEIFASFSQFSHTFSFFQTQKFLWGYPVHNKQHWMSWRRCWINLNTKMKFEFHKLIISKMKKVIKINTVTEWYSSLTSTLTLFCCWVKSLPMHNFKKNQNLILVFTPSHWFTHCWIDQELILVSGPFINQNILWLVNTSL